MAVTRSARPSPSLLNSVIQLHLRLTTKRRSSKPPCSSTWPNSISQLILSNTSETQSTLPHLSPWATVLAPHYKLQQLEHPPPNSSNLELRSPAQVPERPPSRNFTVPQTDKPIIGLGGLQRDPSPLPTTVSPSPNRRTLSSPLPGGSVAGKSIKYRRHGLAFPHLTLTKLAIWYFLSPWLSIEACHRTNLPLSFASTWKLKPSVPIHQGKLCALRVPYSQPGEV